VDGNNLTAPERKAMMEAHRRLIVNLLNKKRFSNPMLFRTREIAFACIRLLELARTEQRATVDPNAELKAAIERMRNGLPTGRELKTSTQVVHDSLNEALCAFDIRPEIRYSIGRNARLYFDYVPQRGIIADDSGEWSPLDSLVLMIGDGSINGIRKCKGCGTYFVGRKNKASCSARCWNLTNQASGVGKEIHRLRSQMHYYAKGMGQGSMNRDAKMRELNKQIRQVTTTPSKRA
jgi:hypothetical protein